MTREEIKMLLNKKIKEAKEMAELDHGGHNNDAWHSYYNGIARGLEDAKGILGM